MVLLKITVVLCAVFGAVAPHGHLAVPPGRSSLWRYGFDAPANYDDNGLNCGGKSTQYERNGGKCGVCGDPWHITPRPNEAGGIYANGIIGRHYQSGDRIDVEVVITANHRGYFEFRLCPSVPVTQACLNQYLLPIEGQSASRYYLPEGTRTFKMAVRLPADVTCTQCVFQWMYTAGNNWGCFGTDCGTGKGPQEQFINCADIAITPSGRPHTSFPPTQRPYTPSPTQRPFTPPPTQRPNTVRPTSRPFTAKPTLSPDDVTFGSGGCRANRAGLWGRVPGLDVWCANNCALGFCPASHCTCN